jgi:hypothetical protein
MYLNYEFEMEEIMKYILILLLLTSTIVLFAQAMPRVILVKIQTADGSPIAPSDIFIRAYFQERPEEIKTSVTNPKHFNTHEGKSSHKGFYVMLNPAAFRYNWAVGETLIADVTQVSTGALIHFTYVIPQSTSVAWLETPLTLTHTVPNRATSPSPADKSTGISSNLTAIGWSYNLVKGYQPPIAFRLAIDTDSLFSNATVLYIRSKKTNKYSELLPKSLLPLKSKVTYYWKVIPTVSSDTKIQPSSLRPIRINGNSLKSQQSGDAINVPVWRFTTGG